MTRETDAVTTENRAPERSRPGEETHSGAAGGGGSESGPPRGRRRPRALTVVSIVAVALFALWGIGTPLIGGSSLTSTNEMVSQSPYAESGFAASTTNNSYMDDTYTGELPGIILYKGALQDGLTNGQWDPYMSGGTPLAATPNYALASPLTVPYYLLPTWLAPAYERLLEIIVAVGGCFLFLRRLKLSRPTAITAGMVFAASGFMVAWLDFPQTRVAAFIPVLFWTIERYLQERRLRDAALISIPVASMLLGGFPSVTGYTLLTAGAYTLVRIIADSITPDAGRRSALRRAWRPILATAAGAVAGVGLAAFQLLPFSAFLSSWYTNGRAQTSTAHLDVSTLLTAIAPFAFGGVNANNPPLFYDNSNFIEAVGYISAAAAVLALVALALHRSGRALLPRGIWVFFVVATLLWAELVYLGGWPLAAFQNLPGLHSVFATNFIARSRSVLGFLLAVLAAVGFELLLQHRASRAATATSTSTAAATTATGTARPRSGTIWAVGVGVVMAAVTGLLVAYGAENASNEQTQLTQSGGQGAPIGLFWHQLLYGALLTAAAIACVVLLRLAAKRRELPDYDRVWRKTRFAAAAALPLLIAGQSLSLVWEYYPKSPSDTFYPVTDTHSYLAANLGDQRYASSDAAMVFGTNVAYDLRSVNGHAFISANFAALVQGIPGNPVPVDSYIDLDASQAVATSPILDVLGTKYFVAALSDPVFGAETQAKSDGTQLTLQPGQSVTEPVPTTGPLRGIGITAQGTVPTKLQAADPNSWIQLTVRDSSGAQVAQSKRLTNDLTSANTFVVPVAADSVAAGTQLSATFTLHATAPLTVAATNGTPALTTVAGADDGLKLVHVGTSAIYQRLTAQPRIRWAANSLVVTNPGKRVQLLAAGKVNGSSVVLSNRGEPQASGQPASVKVSQDGLDTISATVNASGQGYLVVADADQVGWTATVDGKKTRLLPADEGVVAVNVPAGTHDVALHFTAPHGTAGEALTAGTVVALIAVVLGEVWWIARRRKSGPSNAELTAEER